jgi:hypothetical protein
VQNKAVLQQIIDSFNNGTLGATLNVTNNTTPVPPPPADNGTIPPVDNNTGNTTDNGTANVNSTPSLLAGLSELFSQHTG